MIGRTHKRIARKIAEELKLGKREASLLETGSVSPDSWENFPHHKGKEKEIIANIVDSRILFLEDDDECYHQLGVALHYIQDRWTLKPRLKDKHTRWEMEIDSVNFADDVALEEIIKSIMLPTKAEEAYLFFLSKIRNGIRSFTEEEGGSVLNNLSKLYYKLYSLHERILYYMKGYCIKILGFSLESRPTTWSGPALDLNFAYRICLEVARCVLNKQEVTDQVSGLEEKVSQFPHSYFGDNWSLNKLVNVSMVDLEAGYFKKYGYLSIEKNKLRLEKINVPQKVVVKKAVKTKKRRWFFVGREIESEREIEEEEERQVEIFRVYLNRDRPVYIDCRSKNLALYLLNSLESLLGKQERNHILYSHVEWLDFLNFPVPDEERLGDILGQYENDRKSLVQYKEEGLCWNDKNYLKSYVTPIIQKIH